MTTEISTVGIVGCGVMGAGLADMCARAGLAVTVSVRSGASQAAGQDRIAASLGKAVARGKITESEQAAALSRIQFATQLDELATCQLVFESVTESEPVKQKLLAELDSVLGNADAIVATITSSLLIGRLAAATTRADRVVGTHFFNPVQVMQLVEVVAGSLTGHQTVIRAESFLIERLGKQVIRSKDRPGFIVNALLLPLLLDAIRMVESGHADAADVDRGMVLGCGHPMGPLALADFTGLDTLAAVAESLYEETRSERHQPPALLLSMVAAGDLGTKTGRGFHTYR